MRLDNLETVAKYYEESYGPSEIFNDRKGKNISTKKPPLLTDLVARIVCLYEGISNSFEYLYLRLTTNIRESSQKPHYKPDGMIQSLQNDVAQGKNKVAFAHNIARIKKAEMLSKAYFQSVIDPREGLKNVIGIFAAEKIGKVAFTGADALLNGADTVLNGANSIAKSFTNMFS